MAGGRKQGRQGGRVACGAGGVAGDGQRQQHHPRHSQACAEPRQDRGAAPPAHCLPPTAPHTRRGAGTAGTSCTACLHDLGCAQLVAAVDEEHLAAILGQEVGLLAGCTARTAGAHSRHSRASEWILQDQEVGLLAGCTAGTAGTAGAQQERTAGKVGHWGCPQAAGQRGRRKPRPVGERGAHPSSQPIYPTLTANRPPTHPSRRRR